MRAFNWTELAIAAARKSHALGKTAAKTAADLKRAFGGTLSRNAVIGKWFRMGLSDDEKDNHARAARRSRPRAKAKPKSPAARRSRTMCAPSLVPSLDGAVDAAHPDQASLVQRKQLLDLGPGDCRWPIGDPKEADFFFCGAPQLTGSSYCRRHDHIATTPRPRMTNGG
jgi:GcrA cell cycle regulator